MHIPDGFINGATSLGAGVVAAGGLGVSLRASGRYLQDRQIPLAGLLAAFVFVLQMLNFPVAAGTSGHLLGGALAAVLVGPWLGAAVISVVVIVQALLFADGGISALGLNVLNMALITTLVAWVVFRLAMAVLPRRVQAVGVAAFAAALVSVVASSAGFVAEYALGGAGGAPIRTVLAAMVGVHTLIGIGEGLITAAVVGAVLAVRPDLVHAVRRYDLDGDVAARRRPRLGLVLAGGAAVALLLAFVVAPLADDSPDGLERVAIDQGFAAAADDGAAAGSPLADYGVAGVEDEASGTRVAAAVGFAVTLGAAVALLAGRRAVGRRKATPAA